MGWIPKAAVELVFGCACYMTRHLVKEKPKRTNHYCPHQNHSRTRKRANRAHFVHCLIPLNPKVLKTKRLEQYFQFQKESNRFDVRLTMFVVLFK